ncbi:hypothetical protein HDV63DRAFT_278028 [Trichoderma sp. SZMC 28014]
MRRRQRSTGRGRAQKQSTISYATGAVALSGFFPPAPSTPFSSRFSFFSLLPKHWGYGTAARCGQERSVVGSVKISQVGIQERPDRGGSAQQKWAPSLGNGALNLDLSALYRQLQVDFWAPDGSAASTDAPVVLPAGTSQTPAAHVSRQTWAVIGCGIGSPGADQSFKLRAFSGIASCIA